MKVDDKNEPDENRDQPNEEQPLHEAHDHQDNLVEVIIRTPTGKWPHSFEKTEHISQVIADAISHFSLEPGDYKLERKSTSEMLDPHRTLVSYHIQNGEVLNLIPPDGGGQ